MTVVVNDLLLLVDQAITSVIDDLNQPITLHLGHVLYARVTPAGENAAYVNVNKMISYLGNVVPTQSYQTFLTSRLINDLIIATYTVPSLPQRDVITGQYPHRVDVFDALSAAGYSVGYGNANTPGIIDDLSVIGTATDVVITPPTGTNTSDLLVAVNGVFHSTVETSSVLYVLDGYENIRQSGKQSVVICDTSTVGGHTIVPITEDMIISSDDTLVQEITLKMPAGVSLTDQSILVVIDGYMQILNGTYQVMNDTVIKLYSYQIDLLGNFINNPNMRYKTDLFGTKNRPNPYNPSTPTQVTQSQYPTDASDPYLDLFNPATSVSGSVLSSTVFIKSRIASPHSFIVVIHNPDLFVSRYPLFSYGDAQRYEYNSLDTPRGFLLHGRGKVLPYTITSSPDGEHILYLPALDTTTDAYETAYQPALIPSARADVISLSDVKSVTMIDLYSR